VDLYTLTLPLDASATATLRAWLTTVLEGNTLAQASSREILLAATEAVNSALRNSAPLGTTVVVVTISIVGRDVYIRVTDRERSALDAGQAETGSDRDLTNELGLTLMNGLMDEVDLHQTDDGRTVRLVKRLRLPTDRGDGAAPLTATLRSRPAV
jgi:anti-sigma regulatory factor (Ser/Thr protein kinase)